MEKWRRKNISAQYIFETAPRENPSWGKLRLLRLLHRRCSTGGESGAGSEDTILLRCPARSWKRGMSSRGFLCLLRSRSLSSPRNASKMRETCFHLRLLPPLPSNPGREGAGLTFGGVGLRATRVLKPRWSKGCPGSRRRRRCFEFALLLSRSTLVFYGSFKDAETALIRSCQDTARSGAVIGEM